MFSAIVPSKLQDINEMSCVKKLYFFINGTLSGTYLDKRLSPEEKAKLDGLKFEISDEMRAAYQTMPVHLQKKVQERFLQCISLAVQENMPAKAEELQKIVSHYMN